MTHKSLTREGVEAAEPLTFPMKRTSTIRMAYKGVPVEVTLEGAGVAEVERTIDGLLSREGWGAAPAEQVSAPAPAASAEGAPPLCPTHHKPMKPMTKPDRQGRRFWCTCNTGDDFCPERA